MVRESLHVDQVVVRAVLLQPSAHILLRPEHHRLGKAAQRGAGVVNAIMIAATALQGEKGGKGRRQYVPWGMLTESWGARAASVAVLEHPDLLAPFPRPWHGTCSLPGLLQLGFISACSEIKPQKLELHEETRLLLARRRLPRRMARSGWGRGAPKPKFLGFSSRGRSQGAAERGTGSAQRC